MKGEMKMIKTVEEINEVREMAVRLEELRAPRKAIDKIRQWVNQEKKRVRDEARYNTR